LDDVRFYSRVLTANDIVALYNSGSGTESELSGGGGGQTNTLDFSSGLNVEYTQTGSVALVLSPYPVNGQTACVIPTHGTTNTIYATTFSTNVCFSGGTPPTLTQSSGAIDKLFFTSRGTWWDFDHAVLNLLHP
jgi:hypothetical protein